MPSRPSDGLEGAPGRLAAMLARKSGRHSSSCCPGSWASLLFTGGPIVASIVISLTNWNLLTAPKWVGMENYGEMISDWNFWQSIKVTLRYVVLSTPLYLVAGLGLALLLNAKVEGHRHLPHHPVPSLGPERRGGGRALRVRC